MEEHHAADGPESFGWIANTGCDKSKPSSRDEIRCHTEMLSSGVDGLDLLDEDPRLQTISSSTREAMAEKARLLLDKKGVWRGPPTSDGKPSFSVSSFSQERPNCVVMDKNTGRVCELEVSEDVFIRFSFEGEDTLHEYLDFYAKQPMLKKGNLTKVSNLDENVGPLGRKGRRVRKFSKATPLTTITVPARRQQSSSLPTHCTYSFRWLSENKAYQCYECISAFSRPPTSRRRGTCKDRVQIIYAGRQTPSTLWTNSLPPKTRLF